jgi:hypothetical protein
VKDLSYKNMKRLERKVAHEKHWSSVVTTRVLHKDINTKNAIIKLLIRNYSKINVEKNKKI